MAIVENDDPRADESCALAENPAGLNGFDNGELQVWQGLVEN
jgi:hypothetical protein